MCPIQDYELPLWYVNQRRSNNVQFTVYQLQARLLATMFNPKYLPPYDKARYQADHKLSLFTGWLNAVPLHIIANKANLEIVPKAYNQRKGSSNSQTLAELYETYHYDPLLESWANKVSKITDPDRLTKLRLYTWDYYKEKQAA